MRFGNHVLNEQRTVTKFAWFPITIDGETRWLERVTYIEEWYAPDHCWGWYKVKFVDEKV